MLPVIFLVGCTSSGKGTLGKRLAQDFNMYHLSLGETLRALNRQRRQPIDGMSAGINACLLNEEVIPGVHLAQFPPGRVPLVLQLHNYKVRYGTEPNIAPQMLEETMNRLMSRGPMPRAVIVDGLHSAFAQKSITFDVLQEFAPSFSGLTIHIQCPRSVAKRRYLQRGRRGESAETFERRMEKYDYFTPRLLSLLGTEGEVVETVNDDTMSIDQAYRALLENLDGLPLWRFLCGNPIR